MKYFCPSCQSNFPNEDCLRCREYFEVLATQESQDAQELNDAFGVVE